ncbi:hypothetical protein BC833DRAFT_163296 [Globomyces pollinis-pini]|nr:hypothetical protein BC833DRAFT_163296 [Globomyces pollinis-pini]
MSELDQTSLKWVDFELQREANRIRESALKPIIIPVKRCEILPGNVNLLEIKTNLDVSIIKEIVVSDPKIYPNKSDTLSVTVLMMGTAPEQPYLCTYIFRAKIDRSMNYDSQLKDWIIVNSQGKQKRHTIRKNPGPAIRLRKINVER